MPSRDTDPSIDVFRGTWGGGGSRRERRVRTHRNPRENHQLVKIRRESRSSRRPDRVADQSSPPLLFSRSRTDTHTPLYRCVRCVARSGKAVPRRERRVSSRLDAFMSHYHASRGLYRLVRVSRRESYRRLDPDPDLRVTDGRHRIDRNTSIEGCVCLDYPSRCRVASALVTLSLFLSIFLLFSLYLSPSLSVSTRSSLPRGASLVTGFASRRVSSHNGFRLTTGYSFTIVDHRYDRPLRRDRPPSATAEPRTDRGRSTADRPESAVLYTSIQVSPGHGDPRRGRPRRPFPTDPIPRGSTWRLDGGTGLSTVDRGGLSADVVGTRVTPQVRRRRICGVTSSDGASGRPHRCHLPAPVR